MSGGQRALPSGWRWVRLGEICDVNPARPRDFRRSEDALTTFVPMTAVDETTGTVKGAEHRRFIDVARGYTFFVENDVLFAKITPCMQNKKSAIARELTDGIGFGTTEFHVLRPKKDVLAEWIYYQVREPQFLQSAEAHFTGSAGQQRVPAGFVAKYLVPLPPLTEQRAIVRQLERDIAEVERLRVASERQREAVDELQAAYLRDVFEGEEAQEWPTARLGTVGAIGSGITLGKLYQDAATRSVPYLRVANVKDGYLDLSDVNEISVPERDIEKCRLQYGDLLLTEGGDPDKLGRGTFWQDELPECIHQNHIFRVRFDGDRYLPSFLSMQIGSSYGKRYFLARAKQTTGIATINQQVLANFPLMVPSLDVQEETVHRLEVRMEEVTHLQRHAERQRAAVEALPGALLNEVFGEPAS
jgi:type I restriction enzyme, S subunit